MAPAFAKMREEMAEGETFAYGKKGIVT